MYTIVCIYFVCVCVCVCVCVLCVCILATQESIPYVCGVPVKITHSVATLGLSCTWFNGTV